MSRLDIEHRPANSPATAAGSVWPAMFHGVDGYGGDSVCGLRWSQVYAATNHQPKVTCRRCLHHLSEVHGIRTTRGGMHTVSGRRYRSRLLALRSVWRRGGWL